MSASARLVSLLIALASLLLTSCATEDDPVPIFEEPSATPTPSAAANPTGKETVREFLERWADAEHEYQTTGNPKSYEAVVENCAPCDEFTSTIERIHAAGGSVSTDPRTIDDVTRLSPGQLQVEITNAPTRYTESVDGVPLELEGGTRTYLMHVSARRDSFVLTDMELLAE